MSEEAFRLRRGRRRRERIFVAAVVASSPDRGEDPRNLFGEKGHFFWGEAVVSSSSSRSQIAPDDSVRFDSIGLCG